MRVRTAIGVLTAALASGAGAAAQPESVEALAGRRVSRIEVSAGGQAVTAADILSVIQTRVGQPLDFADVRESVLHLSSIGRFDQVEVEATPADALVALTYRLVETRRVANVDFRGAALGVSKRRLRQVLGARAIGSATPARLAAAESALRAFYLSQGYFAATVAASVDPASPPPRARLVFTIETGPRARVGQLRVEADGLTTAEVLAKVGLRPGQPWDEDGLAQRSRRYVESLRQQGYYEASVAWSLARDPSSDLVDITLEARLGPLVDLRFDGREVPERRLRELVPVVREGAVDEDLLEDSKRRIEAWLRGDGYARPVVEYERAQLSDRLRVTFRVRRGALFRVQRVDLEGVDPSRQADVTALIQVLPGAPFSQDALSAATSAVEEYYRARGFGAVRVTSTLAEVSGTGEAAASQVRPTLTVVEGARTLVGRVVVQGAGQVPEEEIRGLMTLRPDGPFNATHLLADRNAVSAYYHNRGFRDARVDVVPRAAGGSTNIDVAYDITEGQQFLVGHVLISGNTRTRTDTIARELGLAPGAPLGLESLAEAQRRLNALGLFRRVVVDVLAQPGRRATDVAVTVDEAPPTTLGYGLGLEGGRRRVRDTTQSETAVDKLEISPRGFFEIGRRNLWGKNRSVNLFTRFSLRDRGGGEGTTPDNREFNEFRIVSTYREPRVFGTLADAQINGFVEQGVRSSFNFARQGVNAEMARRFGRLTVVGRYSFGKTKLFDQRLVPEEKPIIDRLFPQVRLSTLSAALVRDQRDDPLDPSSGYVTNAEADVSARSIGSDVGFVKGFVQAFAYRRLPGLGRAVFAGGARLGLATGFGVEVPDATTQEAIRDLPANERFYAGGGTTVRGYALDRLGDASTIDSDGFPRGGNAMVIFNAELRVPVMGPFGAVVFVDSGNVFARAADFDLGRVRTSSGAGLRYRSPIGPIRFDVGVKLDPRGQLDGRRERRWEVHISLGQAF